MRGGRGALLPLLLAAGLGLAGAVACTESLPRPDGERALARVRSQVARGPRVSDTPGNKAVREWIAGELERLGGKVERQAFVDTVAGRAVPLVNVIGRFGPATGRRVALLAHFDSRPWCDEDPDSARRDEPPLGPLGDSPGRSPSGGSCAERTAARDAPAEGGQRAEVHGRAGASHEKEVA